MKDVTTTTGTTVTGSAIEQLLFTENSRTDARRLAHTTIADQATYAYDLAHGLSGGGEVHAEAHAAGLTNLLHTTAPAVVAFALHHLGELLPDLTDEQWARIDAAAVALSLRVCEDLSGANGTEPVDEQLPTASSAPALPTGQLGLWPTERVR
ncbi:hypothetical protein [Streptomyces sp. NPDC048392]|uniref:hypothetical protein n=1 Tax=Streptomyces sp. NPDC048392 TaxID=3365543 RepID=UPI0037111773